MANYHFLSFTFKKTCSLIPLKILYFLGSKHLRPSVTITYSCDDYRIIEALEFQKEGFNSSRGNADNIPQSKMSNKSLGSQYSDFLYERILHLGLKLPPMCTSGSRHYQRQGSWEGRWLLHSVCRLVWNKISLSHGCWRVSLGHCSHDLCVYCRMQIVLHRLTGISEAMESNLLGSSSLCWLQKL